MTGAVTRSPLDCIVHWPVRLPLGGWAGALLVTGCRASKEVPV